MAYHAELNEESSKTTRPPCGQILAAALRSSEADGTPPACFGAVEVETSRDARSAVSGRAARSLERKSSGVGAARVDTPGPENNGPAWVTEPTNAAMHAPQLPLSGMRSPGARRGPRPRHCVPRKPNHAVRSPPLRGRKRRADIAGLDRRSGEVRALWR